MAVKPKAPKITAHDGAFTVEASGLRKPSGRERELGVAAEAWRVTLLYPTLADPVTYEVEASETGRLALKVNALEKGEVLVRVSDQDGTLRFSGKHTVR